ncbi:MAG: hypothetical protein HQM10_22115 [Candidatus Riflebacteria bacterium]|nr:hypothetical protein [Candidatus Riflebacteria bacterium]
MTSTKRGFALQAAILICCMLLTLGSTIIFFSRNQIETVTADKHSLQAYFTGKAGIQHAILKVKLMQKELYDSICFAQGRNPLFDFSRPLSSTNPGPKFLFRKNEAEKKDLYLSATTQPSGWLQTYISDLNSEAEFGRHDKKKILSLQILPESIRSLMREPFSSHYKIKKLEILAQNRSEDSNSVVANHHVVRVEVESTVSTYAKKNYRHFMTHTLKVRRE